ncbi:MAG: hypothetical protein JRN46_01410 [Nitrososphaerota archaeon]|nr:hypothetical protein [Nitrososphaerota archaeon]
MSLTRPDQVLVAGAALVLAAGGTATAALLVSSPVMFYLVFPIGVLGVFVAAAGYLMEDSVERRHGRPAPAALGGGLRFAPSSRAPEPRTHRGKAAGRS